MFTNGSRAHAAHQLRSDDFVHMYMRFVSATVAAYFARFQSAETGAHGVAFLSV